MLKPEKRLGAGRSGEVFLVHRQGLAVARKVFGGDRLARLIHYVFSGAPSGYAWNADALASALYRRQIVADLAEFWFGTQLAVANALAFAFQGEPRTGQLDTEFVAGRPLPLCHPLRGDDGALRTLTHEIMRPLQRRLREAGLDGLVWQAGLGNPVALNNFLLQEDADAGLTFYFIDLESGVPALFPLNPLALLQFYLPRSIRYRRALFDDVDTAKLRRYVDQQAAPLTERLGDARVTEMRERIDRLEQHQHQWKSLPRTVRGIEYQRLKQRLTPEEADYYRRHPLAWHGREARRAAGKLAHGMAVRLPRKIADKIVSIPLRALVVQTWKLVSSQSYRAEFSGAMVRGRIEQWYERGQIDERQRQVLIDELDGDHSSPYLTDFGVHVGMKVAIQSLELTLFAALYAAGIIGGLFFALLIAADGLIYRSAYTLYRSLVAARHFQPLPWVALLVGVLPLVGSLAFPTQMIWSAAGREDRVARFIIYDTLTGIGAKLPIWGGRDTLTEHYFNRLAHRLVGGKPPLPPQTGEES